MTRNDGPKPHPAKIVKSENAARGGRLGARVFEILTASMVLGIAAAVALYVWWGTSLSPTG